MNIIIIGAGASGIACAVKAKQNNPCAGVTVLEHLGEICKKIHATGNGRCNLTNADAHDYELTRDFFESLGLVLRQEESGRVYPYSNQASSVVDILNGACEKYGVNIVYDCECTKFEKIGNIYNVYSNKGIFTGDALVLATGGKSQSALGSDGSGYAIAKQFGHTITTLSPALVQLNSSSRHCRALKGVRTKCMVKIETNGTVVGEEFGELLFADYGISGIVVMDLSKFVSDEKLKSGEEKCIAVIDFVPEMTENQLIDHYRKHGSFEGILPKKLCQILDKQTKGNVEMTAKCIKGWRLIITGTKGYNFAQITKGGVATNEIDSNNQSKLCDNLYILGELTDNQFSCGGFNLNYAFASGIKAANSITNKHYDKN